MPCVFTSQRVFDFLGFQKAPNANVDRYKEEIKAGCNLLRLILLMMMVNLQTHQLQMSQCYHGRIPQPRIRQHM